MGAVAQANGTEGMVRGLALLRGWHRRVYLVPTAACDDIAPGSLALWQGLLVTAYILSTRAGLPRKHCVYTMRRGATLLQGAVGVAVLGYGLVGTGILFLIFILFVGVLGYGVTQTDH